MADAPKWTSDPQNFADTRWVYRRDTTTITWWPHSASPSDSGSNRPYTNQKDADWYCECGTNNWPRRQHCFACFAPRTKDQTEAAQKSSASTLDPEKPENAPAKGSENAVDPPPQQKQ